MHNILAICGNCSKDGCVLFSTYQPIVISNLLIISANHQFNLFSSAKATLILFLEYSAILIYCNLMQM